MKYRVKQKGDFYHPQLRVYGIWCNIRETNGEVCIRHYLKRALDDIEEHKEGKAKKKERKEKEKIIKIYHLD